MARACWCRRAIFRPSAGYAVLADPHGAVFAVFTPEAAAPGHEGEAQLREFSWHELATHDYPAAFRFYERLFGWEKTSAMDMGEAGVYQMFGRNGVVLGGMFNSSPQDARSSGLAPLRPCRRCEPRHRGGQGRWRPGANGPMEVPGGEWIAQCVDPQGAMFAVHARKKWTAARGSGLRLRQYLRPRARRSCLRA